MEKKYALYLSVNVFTTKVKFEDTIITSPTGHGTAILMRHPSHAKVRQFAGQRQNLDFMPHLFKSMSIGSAQEIEPHEFPLCSQVLYQLSLFCCANVILESE